MILPRLRRNLDCMPSPDPAQPGLWMRDVYRYSNTQLVIPPTLMPGLAFFDGTHTDKDLRDELIRRNGQTDIEKVIPTLIKSLTEAAFLEDETYFSLRDKKHKIFADSPIREPAHAGGAYPHEIGSLENVMRRYLEGAGTVHEGVMAIAAPHVSPQGGWQSYRAAYHALTPDLKDRTFVLLGTSHYGEPNKFGLTRKPFKTPYGTTRVDLGLINELSQRPGALMEDYCHAIEHSIELQVVFLQAMYGPDVRILPILCGSYGLSIQQGRMPEANDDVHGFLDTLGEIAEREKHRLFWIMGVDMAHMGVRYRDKFAAHTNRDEMAIVAERDHLRIDRINAGDARGFWEYVLHNRDDLKWCGSSPIYTFLKAVPQARGRLQRYEQWNIDPQSVVSFAGISFAQ